MCVRVYVCTCVCLLLFSPLFFFPLSPSFLSLVPSHPSPLLTPLPSSPLSPVTSAAEAETKVEDAAAGTAYI
jgi:hypothetical protein